MIPPFVVFDAKQLNHLWTRGEVPGTRYGLSESGWTDRGLFYGWLEEHFLAHAVPGRPLLLLVDGHSSHYDPDSIRYARDRHVIIFCLPPHTTHEAQPLDIGFFSPMKNNWGDVCHDFIQSSPGKAITKFNFCELFAKAWMKTSLPEIVCSGFRKAGIIPFDSEVLIKRCPGEDGALELRRKVQPPNNESPKPSPTDQQPVTPTDEQQPPQLDTPMDGHQPTSSCPMFSIEKERLFCQRFEEGYNLYDEEYISWLRLHHPDAVNESSFVNFFPDTEPLSPINSSLNDASPMDLSSPSLNLCSGVNPGGGNSSSSSNNNSTETSSSSSSTSSSHGSSVLVPETLSSNSTPPLFSSSPASIPCTPVSSSGNASSNSSSSNSCHTPLQKRSPLSSITNLPVHSTPKSYGGLLSKYLDEIPTQENTAKKTGQARVLTSNECIEMLNEKKRKKEQEAIEKEERKKERDRKKLEREELVKKKKEERLLRQKERQEAALKKQKEIATRKATRAAAIAAKGPKGRSKTRSGGIDAGRTSTRNFSPAPGPTRDPPDSPVHSPPLVQAGSTASTSSPGPSSTTTYASCNSEKQDETECECCFCYGSYCQDGREWVMCACGRWVHEECMEEIFLDDSGQERFCPFCIN